MCLSHLLKKLFFLTFLTFISVGFVVTQGMAQEKSDSKQDSSSEVEQLRDEVDALRNEVRNLRNGAPSLQDGTLNQTDQAEQNKNNQGEENGFDKFYHFSMGYSFALNGDDVGIGLILTTPYFLANIMSVYLEALAFIVNSKVYHPKVVLDDDYRLYQIYGNLRLGFHTAYTRDFLRGYSKMGVSLILLRDKTGKDYINVTTSRSKVNDTTTDTIWGLHLLLGIEALITNYFSLYIESGFEFLLDGTINPDVAVVQDSSKVDIGEINFNFMFGSRWYF